MRLYKLLSKISGTTPVELYQYGEYLGRWNGYETGICGESITDGRENEKVQSIYVANHDGNVCLQVYLKD